jgi:hypothetical protein
MSWKPTLRTQVLAVLVAMAFTFAVMVPSGAFAAPTGGSSASTLVQGVASGGTLPAGSTFNGVLTITNFTNAGGVLTAVGTIAGTVVDSTGATLQTITAQPFSAPVNSLDASCQILSLTLGPLHLNLLGLVIDLNQVVLNITAVSGAGNLLGNLLCAVANLLNNPPSNLVSQLVTLLNQILAAL